jgi:hypothetical protein
MNETLRRFWPVALVGVLAVLYLWIGLAAHGVDQILAIAGAVVILGALVVAYRSRWAAVVLLAVGALPLAASTWWSIATPVLAVLTLLVGWFAIDNLINRRRAPTESTLESLA